MNPGMGLARIRDLARRLAAPIDPPLMLWQELVRAGVGTARRSGSGGVAHRGQAGRVSGPGPQREHPSGRLAEICLLLVPWRELVESVRPATTT